MTENNGGGLGMVCKELVREGVPKEVVVQMKPTECETLNMNASGEELPEYKTPEPGGSMLVRGTGKKQLNGHILWD